MRKCVIPEFLKRLIRSNKLVSCISSFAVIAKLYFQKGLNSLCTCSISLPGKESYTQDTQNPEASTESHISILNSGHVKGTLETMKQKNPGVAKRV